MIAGITLQSWGSFTVYATSYLRLSDPDIEYADTAWVTAITGCMVGFTSFLGGWLLELQGPQFASGVGGFVVCMGVYLSTFTIKQGLLLFLFTYAFIVGLGVGLFFPAPMQAVIKWFPNRQGLITGLVMCGSSAGPMIATALQTWLINPDNLKPEEVDGHRYFKVDDVLDRIENSLLVMSLSIAFMTIVGSFLLTEPSKADVAEASAQLQEQQPLIEEQPLVSYTPSQVLLMREFWLMWFCYFLNMLSVNFAMNNVKVFGQNQGTGMSDHRLSWLVSAAALFNGLGRLGWGYIGDRTSFRWAIVGLSGIKALSIATLAFSAKMGFHMYFFSVAVMFACVGGASSIWAGTTNTYFGVKHFGRNFGLVTTAGGAGWIVGAAVFQFANDLEYTEKVISWWSAGFSVTAAVCGFLLRDPQDLWHSNVEKPE